MKPAFPWTALGLGVAILLLSGGLEGCRSARSALQLPTQGPSLSSQAVRSRAIQGQVLSLQDSVSPVPRVELVFRQVDPDSLARAWRVLTQQDGRYRLVLPAGRRYRVDVSCETRYVATAEIELLQPTPDADSSAVEHPFYVPCQAPEPIREAAPRLYFAAGQASLSPKAVHTLEYVRDVLVLQANTPLAVRLEGHATKQEVPPGQAAPQQYLLRLGQRRALAAADYLHRLGIPANRLAVHSFGSQHLPVPDSLAEALRFNSCVVISLVPAPPRRDTSR
jgi:peptidoglycan-associated lipoprotein